MSANVLIIGASGRIGSKVVNELTKNSDGINVILSTSRPDVAEKWRGEGRNAVVLDLNRPETFPQALKGVDRVFLLTGYTSDMLYQTKMFVDAAVDAAVGHIVHLGVYTTRRDPIPHFAWHDLLENYIQSSGIAWTHLHPNAIIESVMEQNPPMAETATFSILVGDQPQGWVSTIDIAAVAAAVLREGPEKHGGAEYWMSIDVLTGSEIAKILTEAAGREIKCQIGDPSSLEAYVIGIEDVGTRTYMESAVITMKLTADGKMFAQTALRDDVQTVLGRPGTDMVSWARDHFSGGHGVKSSN